MFGKNLLNELIHYLRRVWPSIVTVAVASVLAYIFVLTDKNQFEAWGLAMGGALLVIATVQFVLGNYVYTFISCIKKLSAKNLKSGQCLKHEFLVKYAAYLIYTSLMGLILFAGWALFIPSSVVWTFSTFGTDWPYLIEFIVYYFILISAFYLIPVAWITLFRSGAEKRVRVRSLIAGIIALNLCLASIELEVFLLIHSPTTDMVFLWITTVAVVAICAFVAIRAFILTYRTLKKQTENADCSV